MTFRISLALCLVAMLAACSDTAGTNSAPSSDAGTDRPFDTGTELRVAVPEEGRVYVRLNPPSVVTPGEAPAASSEWDLAFEGYEIFTNGGASGQGKGSAFGPLDAITFIGDVAPEVPFYNADKTGGAFLDWYGYEGAPAHALWSRYHVFGVKDGDRLWKVQILSYYGERDGAPTSSLYRLRYAELTADGVGPTTDLTNLDGTAGGTQAPPGEPSECLDLGTGTRTMQTPDVARDSTDWHLCVRRQAISVNGELGGRRGIGAVDLDAAETPTETISVLKERSAETELARFDAVTRARFDGKTFRGDRIVSAFGSAWVDDKASPPAPVSAAWLVVGADGSQKFLVGFSAFENATTRAAGTVVMRIKPVKG